MQQRRLHGAALAVVICAVAAPITMLAAAAPPTNEPATTTEPVATVPTDSSTPASGQPATEGSTTPDGTMPETTGGPDAATEPDITAPGTTTPDEAAPQEAGPHETGPGETGSDETGPGGTASPDTTAVPAPDCLPATTAPGEQPDVAGRGAAALFVASIALVETGYDFRADRDAVSGAYLLSDADWAGHRGYARAAEAPPEVQTERAESLAAALLASGITAAELSGLWLHSNSVSADGGHGGPVAAYVDEVAEQATTLAATGELPPTTQPATTGDPTAVAESCTGTTEIEL